MTALRRGLVPAGAEGGAAKAEPAAEPAVAAKDEAVGAHGGGDEWGGDHGEYDEYDEDGEEGGDHGDGSDGDGDEAGGGGGGRHDAAGGGEEEEEEDDGADATVSVLEDGAHCQLLQKRDSGHGEWVDVQIAGVVPQHAAPASAHQQHQHDAAVPASSSEQQPQPAQQQQQRRFVVLFCRPRQAKERFCKLLLHEGACKFGDTCRFSHGCALAPAYACRPSALRWLSSPALAHITRALLLLLLLRAWTGSHARTPVVPLPALRISPPHRALMFRAHRCAQHRGVRG